jgi:hypothetical protein
MTANRKKTETLHMRLNFRHKLYLVALANVQETTASSYVETLLDNLAAKQTVDGCLGTLTIKDAVDIAIIKGSPAMTALRTFYIAPQILSPSDMAMQRALECNMDYFGGTDEILTADEIGTGQRPPSVNAALLADHLEVLQEYANFAKSNPHMVMSYVDYRRCTGRSE